MRINSEVHIKYFYKGWQRNHLLLLLLIILLALYTLFFVQKAWAFTPPSTFNAVQLYDGQNQYSLNQALRYWRDKKGTATLNDILKINFWKVGSENHDAPLNLGYTTDKIWIAIPLRYDGKKTVSEWWLEINNPLLEHSEFYLVDNTGKLLAKKTINYTTPLHDRDIPYVTPVYKLFLKKNETATVYLKVASDFSVHVPIRLMTPVGFSENVAVSEMVYGSFFGAMIIMMAYNFFVYLSVRESSFIWYVFYIASYLIFLIIERVRGITQVLGYVPEFMQLQYLTDYIWFFWLFALLMGRAFLETKKHYPDLDKLIIVFIQGVLVSLVVSQVTNITIAVQWAVMGSIIYAIFMIGFVFTIVKRGNRTARYYLFAWIMSFGGIGIYALMITGVLPFNLLTSNSPSFGIMFQLTLISFAMSDRTKVAQRQTLDANRRALDNLQRYHTLFNHAVEGICQIGLNRRFIDANPAMASMMGFASPGNMIDTVPDAFSVCFDDLKKRDDIVQYFEGGNEFTAQDASFTTIRGKQRWASSVLRMTYDRNGEPLLIECTFVDITEKIEKTRVEGERAKDRLERRIAESSAAAKSQFLANMSHEIRTPLTAIIGFGESLLDKHISNEERIDSAEVVVRSGRHLLELINDILDHSKIDADKLDVDVFTVDLLGLLAEVKTYFDAKAAEKGIEFSVQYEFPLPEQIMTDPTRLKQILINLCGNALKFTDRGGVTVIARCHREDERVSFKIVDTGTGVKPEQLERLFDPFAQASPSIARQFGGTGLGLSISKRLATLLGGDVTASSTYGEGSEFEVSISTGPLNKVAFVRNSSELNLRSIRIVTAQIPALKGDVLYAEDNEINQKLINQLVSKTGATIAIVNNGAEALEIASREHFNLILMDIQMPVMDGRDATKAIRDAGVNTPIVALTANVMVEDVAEYKEAGCNETIAKPVIKQQFYEMLSRYLDIDENMVVPHQVSNKSGKHATLLVEPTIPVLQGIVLLAEDNRDNRMLMARYLKKAGLEVITAEDGEVAVQKALSESVNLIMMDHHMPKMNGPKAVQMLRQTGFSRPILAFTASDADDEVADMQQAGCDGVISKPIKTEQLYAKLAEFLPARKQIRSPRVSTSSGMSMTGIGDGSVPEQWDDADLVPIVQQFIEGIPQRMETMSEALKVQDWNTLQGLAHQIKGTASSLGFPDLTEAAKVLEQSLKKEERQSIESIFSSLKGYSEQAMLKFNIFLGRR